MYEPPWLPGCLENLRKIPGAVLCEPGVCENASRFIHAICNCQPPYVNGCTTPTPGCCAYGPTAPIFVASPTPCYCCCGDIPAMVATGPDAARAADAFAPGDTVRVAMNPELTVWDELPVQFSAGTGPLSMVDSIRIRCGDANAPETILATPDQLFLTQGCRLKRASRLVPGLDSLTRPDSTAAPVLDLAAGKSPGGRHQLATSTKPTADWAGHLIVVDGVVCGDYSLQLTDLDAANPGMMAEGHADMPEFGTRAYAEQHGHRFPAPAPAPASEGEAGFAPLPMATAPRPADDGTAFVTADQATDIGRKAPRQPAHSGAGRDMANYLFKLYTGFFPDIGFRLDEANELPNAYSRIENGKPTVVVNGGLIRTDAVRYEGLALIIAHQIAVLQGSPPKDPQGYSCRGQADLAAVQAIIPYAWFGPEIAEIITPAIEQITTLFDFIAPAHRAGKPGDHCNAISIECRLDALAAGASAGALPACAGGR